MIDIAVVGATGAIGGAMLAALAESELTFGRVHALASATAVDEVVLYGHKSLSVQDLAEFDFGRVALALFAVPAVVAAEFVPRAVAAGAMVVDCSGQFRGDPDTPLIAAAVNPEDLASCATTHIVATPGSLAIQLARVLKPVHEDVGVQRVQVATYQSVSSAGKRGLTELAGQAASLLNGKAVEAELFPRQIAFNLIPQIGGLGADDKSDEEIGLINDMRRLLQEPEMDVDVTCVQVPVFYGSAQAVRVQTQYPLDVEAARALLANTPGLVLGDSATAYAVPVGDLDSADQVFVGRIRGAGAHVLNLWLVADNVHIAARNAVRVAESLIKAYL